MTSINQLPATGIEINVVEGDTAFDVTYIDGATQIPYIYMVLNTSAITLRQMVI